MILRLTLIIILLTISVRAFSQSQIQGYVRDENSKGIAFANVYIENRVDGTSTDENGHFTLETEEKGSVTLIASFVGYKPFSITSDVSKLNNLAINLKPDLTNLNEVVVTALNVAFTSKSPFNANRLDSTKESSYTRSKESSSFNANWNDTVKCSFEPGVAKI